MKKLFGLITILSFPLLSMDKAEKGQWVLDKKIPVKRQINSIKFAPLGNHIRTIANNYKEIQIWNAQTGEQEVSCPLDMPATVLGFDRDETRCMAVGHEGQRCGFDLVKCEPSYAGEKIPDFYSNNITFNDNCTLALAQNYTLGVLFDALTGKIKKTLWKLSDSQANNKSTCASFIGSVVNVFHDGCLADCENDDNAIYRPLVPQGTSAPEYSKSEKKLVCFHSRHCFEAYCFSDLRKISVIDIETEKLENFNLMIHPYANCRYEKRLLDGGSCLGMYFIGYAIDDYSSFDVYSLKTLKLIFSRKLKESLDADPCLKKNLLTLTYSNAIELWNVEKKEKVADLESSRVMDINDQGNKIAIAKENEIIIFKQLD